jgi:hypothetical protein
MCVLKKGKVDFMKKNEFNWDLFFKGKFYLYFYTQYELDSFKKYIIENNIMCEFDDICSRYIEGVNYNGKNKILEVSERKVELNYKHEIIDWKNFISNEDKEKIQEKMDEDKKLDEISNERVRQKKAAEKEKDMKQKYEHLYLKIFNEKKPIVIDEHINDEFKQKLYDDGVIVLELQKNLYLCFGSKYVLMKSVDKFNNLKEKIIYTPTPQLNADFYGGRWHTREWKTNTGGRW